MGIGKYREAKECGEEVVAIRLKLFGERNSETAMSFHNAGGSFRALGENEKALQYATKALEIWTALHGEDHIDTALALDGVSACYRPRDNRKALEFAERALAIRERVLGALHPDTAMSFSNVGNICVALGDCSRALQCEEKALAIANELFGLRSPLKAIVLNNICLAYRGLREFKKALQAALDSLAMRRELFGDQHPETLVSAVNVATIHFDLGHAHNGFQMLDDYLNKIPKNHSHYGLLKERRRDFQTRYTRPGFRQQPGKRR